jgi:hypothetical protein
MIGREGDEFPLRATGVLKLVDEHVMVPRFEAESALRKLVHLAQQIQAPAVRRR